MKEKVLLLLQTEPECNYNSHYGNGVLAMFASSVVQLKGNIVENPIAVMGL